jgi:glucose-1-phosphate thymidylyltransferase
MITARAIVLARGLGTRMRASDPATRLTPEQQRAADAGLKAMIPLNGRPFLDYILGSLADAGIRHVALIVSPDHQALREYYSASPPERIRLDYVIQKSPLGTADAVRVAEPWVSGEAFLAMNGDNLYPVPVLTQLAAMSEPALPVFERDDLLASSNIPAQRLRSFAFVDIDEQGYLTRIVEKPNQELPPKGGSHAGSAKYISMNCWRLDERIFQACREVPLSDRGEFELPEAVGVALRQGVRFRTFAACGPVLDLSTRADATDVGHRLAGIVPRP